MLELSLGEDRVESPFLMRRFGDERVGVVGVGSTLDRQPSRGRDVAGLGLEHRRTPLSDDGVDVADQKPAAGVQQLERHEMSTEAAGGRFRAGFEVA